MVGATPVEVGETEVAADIAIQVDYPEQLQRVASNVRAAVHEAITELVQRAIG